MIRQARALLRTLENTREPCMLGAAIFNKEGQCLAHFDGQSEAYYDPSDIDPVNLMQFGEEDESNPVVYYKGNQKQFRAHKKSSFMHMVQYGIVREPETSEIMFDALNPFDEIRLIKLHALPKDKRASELIKESTADPSIPPPTFMSEPWSTQHELIPLMRTVANALHGQENTPVVYNIADYEGTDVFNREFPEEAMSVFYIHVRDKNIQECSAPAIAYVFPGLAEPPKLLLSHINNRGIEFHSAELATNKSSNVLEIKVHGLSQVIYVKKLKDGKEFYLNSSYCHNWDNMNQRISLSLSRMRLDINGNATFGASDESDIE